jgi:tetratricopeptide (TPR) repeat protein
MRVLYPAVRSDGTWIGLSGLTYGVPGLTKGVAMKRKAVTGLAVAALCALLAAGEARGQAAIQAAIARAKQTGLPMLVIGVTDTCPHCVKLLQRLKTEPDLQQLLTQYVPIEIKAGTPDWNVWTQQYKPGGGGVPLIYIVDAEGKEVYNKSGAPQGDGLKQLLTMGITQTGGPKKIGPERDAMIAAMRKIETLLERGKKAEAIAAAAPHAAKAAEHDKLGPMIQEWTKEAAAELEKARKQLDSADEVLPGILAALAVGRVYGELPGVKEPLDKMLANVRNDSKKADLLEQAHALEKAQGLEERESKRGAVAAYRTVINRYPDTPAAQLAQKRLEELSPKSVAVASRATPAGGSPPSGGQSDHKKASSYLRMAKTFSASRPEKAKEYAQKVVDLLPDSREAREAQDLIKGLE